MRKFNYITARLDIALYQMFIIAEFDK